MCKVTVIVTMVLALMLGHVLSEQRLVADAMQAEIISLQRAIDAAR